MADNFLIDTLAAEMIRDSTWMKPAAFDRKWAARLEQARIATALHRNMPRSWCSPIALATGWNKETRNGEEAL